MIDFQNGGLEHQVYELIAKMCDLGFSDNFPHFSTRELENGEWECTLAIPGVKRKAVACGKTEVESINYCALCMKTILKRDHNKDDLDPDIDNSIFAGNIEQFFGDVEYNHEYKYHLVETDILINQNDEYTFKLLKHYIGDTIDKIKTNDEEVDDISDIVTIRLLVKKKKYNYC